MVCGKEMQNPRPCLGTLRGWMVGCSTVVCSTIQTQLLPHDVICETAFNYFCLPINIPLSSFCKGKEKKNVTTGLHYT
ncbi:MAG TPA: hypothetical protein VEG44_04005 [Candidatus Acidoferrales bacterium]|nr:hypothetical protein [Candidatus Acidoferrales bacterium]